MSTTKLYENNAIVFVDTRGIENSWASIVTEDRTAFHLEGKDKDKQKYAYFIYMTEGSDITINADSVSAMSHDAKIIYVPANVDVSQLISLNFRRIVKSLTKNYHKSKLKKMAIRVISTAGDMNTAFETVYFTMGSSKKECVDLTIYNPNTKTCERKCGTKTAAYDRMQGESAEGGESGEPAELKYFK